MFGVVFGGAEGGERRRQTTKQTGAVCADPAIASRLIVAVVLAALKLSARDSAKSQEA